MENTFDKITEFFGGDLALALDADAAGMANDLAHHVLRLAGRRVTVLFPFPADWPLGNIIRPNIRSNAGWSLTETETRTSFRF